MHSGAKTIQEYISELTLERQDAITKVRQVILETLPDGYEEVIN